MKLQDKILTIVFCAFIFGLGASFLILPKADFSANEKRELANAPEFSLNALFDGSFEASFEEYLNDRFPFREKLVSTDAYYMLSIGRNGSNGIYKGKNGYLFAKPASFDKKNIDENIDALKSFAQNTEIMSTMILMPSSGYIMSENLPDNHPEYCDGIILDYIRKNTENDIRWVNISDKFLSAKDGEQLYYKTDHHYTTYGAYLAYEAFCDEHGISPYKDYSIEKYDGFYGTSYSKSALWNESPDTFELWRYPSSATVEIDGQVYNSLWFEEHLNDLDKYPVFLNGNQPFERIINPDVEGGNILILKDSYAHALIPFLARHYNRIDVVDLRYYFEPVSELVNENKYDEIFMIYELDSLCNNTDISILE